MRYISQMAFRMTEQAYLVLLALADHPRHGYGIVQEVLTLSAGSTKLGAGTLYGLTWYNGSKGFVNLVSKSMAVELAGQNIRVNCIAPVLGQTALTEEFIGGPATPERLKAFMATIPLGRMSKASDIAAAAVFLASDEAEFITGAVLPVDGGRTI